MTDRALSFGPAASAYDAHRPTYPPAALTWALGDAPRTVVDLGAGTGILTRVLVGLGHEVIPVEPDAQMRAALAAGTPGVEPLAGSAEAIPLPDGSVDAVLAGQAYHWFDHERAHPEIARVLRPGGLFAPIWNIRDESVPWVAELGNLAEGHPAGTAPRPRPSELLRRRGGFGPLFAPLEQAEFAWIQPMTADRVVAMMATRSYYLTATADRRARIEAGIRELVADLGETFDLPYVTEVFRAARR
jgi:SAM-dependent methyltransferase